MRITGFEEKPRFARSNLASMGIYLFNKDALLKHLEEDARDPASRHDFGYAIMPRMSQSGGVFAYRFGEYWQDIGTTDAYYEASMGLLKAKSTLKMDGTWQMFPGDNQRSVLMESHPGTIRDSIISPGCVVKGTVENSVLSPGVWVDEQAVVRNSILMENVSVGFHSIVEQTIADEDAQIGSYCFIGFGDKGDGKEITLLGEGVTVPPHTALGRGCTILPPGSTKDDMTTAVLPGMVIGKREGAVQTL
jgi:glucose-1-phosphate adenylyltransferase